MFSSYQATIRRNYTYANQSTSINQVRQAEEQREDVLKRLAWEQLQTANMKSEERAEDKRFLRHMVQEQKERETLEAIERVGYSKTCRILFVLKLLI